MESLITSQQQKENDIDTKNDKEDDSDVKDDDDNRISFETSEPVDDTIASDNLSEDELKIQDSAADSHECNRLVANWIACEVLWKNFTMKEN